MRLDPLNSTLAALLFVALLGACTKQQTLEHTGLTLETIRATTDVAWTYAVEQDLREQQAVIEELRAIQHNGGTLPPIEEARARLAGIRDRWEPRFAAFEAIRAAHSAAITAWEGYRDGREPLEVLVAAFNDVLDLYAAMQRILGDAPALDLRPEVNP
jgi:hypothetical protein